MSKVNYNNSDLISKHWEEFFDAEAKGIAYLMRKEGRTNKEIAAVLETFRLDKERISGNKSLPIEELSLKKMTPKETNKDKRKKIVKIEVEEKTDSSLLENGCGYVYICFHQSLRIAKIGYSYSISSRLKCHAENGFVCTDILLVNESRAYQFEQFMLCFIKSSGIPMGSDFLTHRFDGWSECWHYDSLPVLSFCELSNCIMDYVINSFPVEMSHEV